MKTLLVGDGAREHIIAERLAEGSELYAIMGRKNPAIAQLSKKHWITNIHSPEAVAKCIEGVDFDIGFASPDAVLAAGISDVLANAGMLVASPLKEAARIEWDKGFMRTLMENNKIGGGPEYVLARSVGEAEKAVREFGAVAVKPLGLTGGKGVRLSGEHFKSAGEIVEYAAGLIKKDGMVLIEEKLDGEEFTLQAFCDGARAAFMPPVQDHKRAFAGDIGANTGGMGSYSSGRLLPFMEESELGGAERIMREALHAMKKNSTPFTGILYGQFMATGSGVKLIEFNSRFGDPEAMNVLSLLDGSLTDAFLSMAEGRLGAPAFSDKCTVVKYLVPDGYPSQPLADAEVRLDDACAEKSGARVYFASVYEKDGKIFTSRSRAFGILGTGGSLGEAEAKVEAGCACTSGPVWHRKDIGTKALVEKRVQHMNGVRQSVLKQ